MKLLLCFTGTIVAAVLLRGEFILDLTGSLQAKPRTTPHESVMIDKDSSFFDQLLSFPVTTEAIFKDERRIAVRVSLSVEETGSLLKEQFERAGFTKAQGPDDPLFLSYYKGDIRVIGGIIPDAGMSEIVLARLNQDSPHDIDYSDFGRRSDFP